MFFSVAAMASNNGYKLLSAQGVETLQTFLREHGNECIRQFVQVKYVRCEVSTAVTVKNAVFWDIKTQFVLHRRHIT
jgi:hypothetical protein